MTVARTISAIGLLACTSLAASVVPVPTSFTYQGQLKQSGLPFHGLVDLTFRLYDASAGGTLLGTVSSADTEIVNGLFSVALDFGALPYTDGQAMWLEIDAEGTTLMPRQEVTATPFSLATRGIQVDETGDVTIGVNPFGGKLTVVRNEHNAIEFERSGLESWAIGLTTNGEDGFAFTNEDDGTQPLFLGQSGNVGIGTASPVEAIDVDGNIRAARTDSAETQVIVEAANGSGPPHLAMGRARGTFQAPVPVQGDDELGEINFKGWDGEKFFVAAGIGSRASDDFSLNWHPSTLEFATTPASGGGRLTRMLIDQDGNVGIGTSFPPLFRLDLQQPNDTSAGGIGIRGHSSGSGSLWVNSSGDFALERPTNDGFASQILLSGPASPFLQGDIDIIPHRNVVIGHGNLGIGVRSAQAKLHVNGDARIQGTIHSTSGGFRFPNGTVQTTAGLTSAIAMINGQDGPAVTLKPGPNVTIVQANDEITISATGGGGTAGITSINNQTGPAITLAHGSGIALSTANNQITISSPADGIQKLKDSAGDAGTSGPDVVIAGGNGVTVTRAGTTFTIAAAALVTCVANGKEYSPGTRCKESTTCTTCSAPVRIIECGDDGAWNLITPNHNNCVSAPPTCGCP